MRVIGTAGQMRSGKDTISDRLKIRFENDNFLWNRFAFANPLKTIFCNNFDVDAEFIEKWKVLNECPPDMKKPVREGLQFVGDGYREIMPSIWINKTFKHMNENSFNGESNYIISDVRYLNEARAIKNAGGLVILIWRKDWENNNSNRSEQEVKPMIDWCRNSGEEGLIKSFVYPNAPAERELFDIFVRNDSTLEILYEKVDTWIYNLTKEHFYV